MGADSALIPISIDGTPVLAFLLQDGHLLLNLVLFDEYNRLVLHVRNNQLLYSTSPWDIQFIGRNLIIREAERKMLVDIIFDVPSGIRVDRGRFLRNGVELEIWPDRVLLTNNGMQVAGNSMINCPVGFALGPHEPPLPAMVSLAKIPRYGRDGRPSDPWIAEAFPVRGPA